MIDNRILIVDKLLETVAQELDIPPSKHQQAVGRYTSVGEWLEGGSYPGATGLPSIFPQGSFRLGTVIRPIKDGKESDYDIDLVCSIPIQSTTAKNLKHMVGNRLKEHGKYKSMLDEEGKRCWTLLYAEEDGIGFHLDVLPARPAPKLIERVDERYSLQAIALTDRKFDAYSFGSTNPSGYADWFDSQNRISFSRVASIQKTRILREHGQIFAKVQEVPDQLVRTPMQRLIQLLKRHRDVRFAGKNNESDKPISMIITTLVAQTYKSQNSVYETLATFLDQIQRYTETDLIRCENDEWRIENPVNPDENFADRWNDEGSDKADAFFDWINWLQEDIDELLNVSTKSELESTLRVAFGDTPSAKIARGYSGQLPGASHQPTSLFGRMTGGLLRFDASHKAKPKWNIRPTRYEVSISAKWTRAGFRPTAFRSNSAPLKKGLSLRFDAYTDAPKPYEVHWQVVNTGDEARRDGQMRGEFYDSNKHSKTRTESTKYAGMHWVECFVVKDDVCVARSGEFVINIK